MKDIIFFLFSVVGVVGAWAEPFKDQAHVVFWGDSITHGGYYPYLVSDFYLTHYLDREIHFYNAGISGNTAWGAIGMFEEDVKPHHPTFVSFMFGMNDSTYKYFDPEKEKDPDFVKKVSPAIEKNVINYEKHMRTLVGLVQKEFPMCELLFFTPTPYDTTAHIQKPTKCSEKKNQTLGRYGEIVKALAQEKSGSVVDWFRSMTDMMKVEQLQKPSWSFTRGDRIHPSYAGHFYMTLQLLLDQGATNVVSHLVVDAQELKVKEAVNASISGLQLTPRGWCMHIKENSLPWTLCDEVKEAFSWGGSSHDTRKNFQKINAQWFAVKGLEAEKSYALVIDGENVGCWRGDEFAHGINLSENQKTPQYRQSRDVSELNFKRFKLEQNYLRAFSAVRWFLKNKKINPDDLDAVEAFQKEGHKGYFENMVPLYLKEYGNRDKIRSRMDELYRKACLARTPHEHVYEVCETSSLGK